MPGRMSLSDTVHQNISHAVSYLAMGRQLPQTPEEWLRATLIAIPLLAVAILIGYAIRRRIFKHQDAELESLMAESAGFSNRWSRGRLSSAPQAELQHEVHRCMRIITLLQWRLEDRKSESAPLNSQIRAVQSWLATVQAARDFAAKRENGIQADIHNDPRY